MNLTRPWRNSGYMETAKAESHGGAVLAVPVKGLDMDHTLPRDMISMTPWSPFPEKHLSDIVPQSPPVGAGFESL